MSIMENTKQMFDHINFVSQRRWRPLRSVIFIKRNPDFNRNKGIDQFDCFIDFIFRL